MLGTVGKTKSSLVVAISVFLLAGIGPAAAAADAEDGGSAAAYRVLTSRAAANNRSFHVYADADSAFDHGFPSGFIGTLSAISLDAACVDDPAAADGCSADPERLDRDRGTVLRVSFGPLGPLEFAGVNIEEPEGFGGAGGGVGYDLRGATEVVFEVRSPTPGGVRVQFGVGEQVTPFMTIGQSDSFQTVHVSLSSLGLTAEDLADEHILFTVVTNGSNAPDGGTLLLDEIRFEPVPSAQASAVGFPLSTQTFGVVPLATAASGRVPFPSDQVLRNLSTIYESAIALDALLYRSAPGDAALARSIADAFDYALANDNAGDPLPEAADGSTGLHSGYFAGDLALRNDQTGPARAGQVRLAGFTASPSACGPSAFCLLLDGTTGGNNAFAALALLSAYRRLGEARYLSDARTIGRWIAAQLADSDESGFGGFFLGYPDEVTPKTVQSAKSTENVADIFALYNALARAERELGNDTQAAAWDALATRAGDFVIAMFDPVSGCFAAGTVPDGTAAGPGVAPDGPLQGNDRVNTYPFIDAQTFPILAMANSPQYRDAIDWRRPADCMLDPGFARTVTAGGHTYSGFDITDQPGPGPAGVAWEFTAQVAAAARQVDLRYGETRYSAEIGTIADELRNAQQTAPFGDGDGLVAATVEEGDTLAPQEHCLSTPFQCIATRVGLAATTWAIFAEIGFDSLSTPLDTTAPDTSISAGPGDGSTTASPSPTFEFSSSEAGSSFECRIDSAAESAFEACWSPRATGPLGEGVHTFAVRATDAAGNTDQSPATRTFTVRPLPPPTFIVTVPASPANDNTPSIRGVAASTVALYTSGDCSGAPVAIGSGADFSGLGLGVTVADDTTTTFHGTTTDAGITSACSTDSIAYTEDSTAPGTRLDSGPSGRVRDATPSFAFHSGEPGASFECKVDGSAFRRCISPHAVARLGDGHHAFAVRAVDEAGNADPTPAKRGFTVDTKPPRARVLRSTWQRAGKPIELKVSCAEVCALLATGRVVAWTAPRTGTVRLARRAKLRFGLGKVARQLGAGHAASVRLRLRSGRARRRLTQLVKRGGRARAKIRVRFTDRAGNTTVARSTIGLRGG